MDHGRIVARGTPAQVLTSSLIARVFGMQASVRSGSNGHLRVEYRRPVKR
jgi:ABC-type hemin transport system ATPase subunit